MITTEALRLSQHKVIIILFPDKTATIPSRNN